MAGNGGASSAVAAEGGWAGVIDGLGMGGEGRRIGGGPRGGKLLPITITHMYQEHESEY